MLLEGIRNIQQQGDLECLVSCCQQVLGHLGIEKEDTWLWNQLQVSTGQVTSFGNLANLEKSLGVVAEKHRDNDDIDQFAPYIESGLPIIVAVDADEPTIWPYYSSHAIVVIGYDEKVVYINDPAQKETGLKVSIREFELAWSRRSHEFAVIRLV